jgi:hypothetical protein
MSHESAVIPGRYEKLIWAGGARKPALTAGRDAGAGAGATQRGGEPRVGRSGPGTTDCHLTSESCAARPPPAMSVRQSPASYLPTNTLSTVGPGAAVSVEGKEQGDWNGLAGGAGAASGTLHPDADRPFSRPPGPIPRRARGASRALRVPAGPPAAAL